MDNYIKGKFKQIIFQNTTNNYLVGLFKVKETNNQDISNKTNKVITVSGIIPNLKIDAPYTLTGKYENHPKYSWQFSFTSYELEKPTTKSAIIEFLSSSLVDGCGEATAKKIVDLYGEKSLEMIKRDVHNLDAIKGITPVKAMKIYTSIMNYEKNDQIILKLTQMGFSLEDASKILNKHSSDIDAILEGNLYLLKDLFEFKKIDDIYVTTFPKDSRLRCKECLLNSMMQISFNEGSTYYLEDEIYRALNVLFNLNIPSDLYHELLNELIKENQICQVKEHYYLSKYYEEENLIAFYLSLINKGKLNSITKIDEKITDIETKLKLTYNDEQKNAIKSALKNNITIITGGPGTGKTTIIKAIVQIYIEALRLSKLDIPSQIALLAPTGRASKKLSLSTGLNAYTIHRFLKWHKDDDSFEYNEENKLPQKLIIVDETSMLDVTLMKSLLAALNSNIRLVLVGDIYQLPSVGPGLVLQDLINSDLFTFNPLNIIYRQSENSYIPFLAKDIKMQNIDDDFLYKRDDYNFLPCSEEEILAKVMASVKYALSKCINEDNMQILAPMYKGINGIDNLNSHLQNLYNPEADNKNEVKYGDKIYREHDKVLQLINDSDKQVFNGDIGKITAIFTNLQKKLIIQINFDGNVVEYEKKDLKNITHAYAITVHKSQGSEFEHVLLPVSKSYYIMLYNKLLYTAVSRAKKSLTIIGDPNAFSKGIQNNYASTRKTSLITWLNDKFKV